MKKHLIALAVAAAVAAPAAMADTTLYGLAHVSVDYIDTDTAGKDANVNIQSGSSRLGVKGAEKLSSGLSAIYQYETTVEVTDGSSLFGSARNAFVGLTGGFGTAILGRHDTPMKTAIAQYDLFGDQIGDNGNIVGAKYGTSAGFNLRSPNVVAYITPNMGGFSAQLAYVTDHDQCGKADDKCGAITDEKAVPSSDLNDNDAYSLSAGYKHKMFDITAAYEVHNAVVGGADLDENSWMVGGGVNFAGVRVNALYQNMENFDNKEANVYGAGVSYTFGKNMVKAQYFLVDSDVAASDELSMLAVGYDYNMSKQTTLYAAYAMGDKGQIVWGDGHGGKTAAGADENSALSVGVKHKF